MINAFHSNWTKPFLIKNDCKEYSMKDYQILITILSALKWRQNNGDIMMVTDSIGAEFFYNRNMDTLWNLGLDTSLDYLIDNKIKPEVFWAAGKICALEKFDSKIVSLDTDMIVWNNITSKIINSEISVIHDEDLDTAIYPSKKYFENNIFFKKHNKLDWTVLPCNTAFMYINNNKFKEYYRKTSIEFMTSFQDKYDPVINMVFAEQRLLSMCAAKLNISINKLYTLDELFDEHQTDFTHIWGEKLNLEKDYNLREAFCIKCIKRILKDFPECDNLISGIPEINKYYKKYYDNLYKLS